MRRRWVMLAGMIWVLGAAGMACRGAGEAPSPSKQSASGSPDKAAGMLMKNASSSQTTDIKSNSQNKDATGSQSNEASSRRIQAAIGLQDRETPAAQVQSAALNTYDQPTSRTRVIDDPRARGLYGAMVQALRDAKTLSFQCVYEFGIKGQRLSRCTYRAWLKKPNQFRVEAMDEKTTRGGTLIGDGEKMWIFWNGARPQFSDEEEEAYRKTSRNVYMSKAAPPGGHSIAHETGLLGAGMGMTIIDLSTFHGYTDSLQPYIDGVAGIGTEMVRGEACDGIEVSFMDHQRSWYLWIAQKDRLPRKLREVVRVNNDILMNEDWTSVTVNGEIADERFRWTPPAGWTEWRMPASEERLLQLGVDAPDFECAGLDGGKIKLSDYRGKVVWLCFWRIGCPPCREEIPELQKLHEKFKGKGLVVLGFNCADDKKLATEFLKKHGVTFPNVLDTSPAGWKVMSELYRGGGVPLNYIIDREGKIGDVRLGYDAQDKEAPYRMLKWQEIE